MTREIFIYQTNTMAITKDQKKEILKDLDDKFGRSKAVYFADYRGLSVKDIANLRKALREEGVDFRVAKKTLMQLSLKNSDLPEAPSEVMQGPVGAAFGYDDVVMAVKTLHNFSKGNDNLKILGGLVEGKFITQAEAVELAKLPSREELLAKLVGSMKAPVSGFYGVTSGLLRGLVQVLKAYGEQKPEEAAAPAVEEKAEEPVKEEAPAEEPKEEAAPEEAKQEEAPAEEKAEEKPADDAEESSS
ncbi:MAG: 50S ribosomal protein L10 [Candidatus Gracilibacteria bacterium]